MEISLIIVLALLGILLIIFVSGVTIVPESQTYIIEQFGRFQKVLKPGLNFVIPMLQNIAHRVDILERQLPTTKLSVITKDNVEISLEISVFYRVVSAQNSVYRIKDVDSAVSVTTASIIRAACGELEFDEIQSRREYLNTKIKEDVTEATAIWGVEITRTEVLDVRVDEVTRKGMQRQLDAERERRAQVLRAEGERQAIQLDADAKLYQAQKNAEAVRLSAEAEAYATKTIAAAIEENGLMAVDFEITKRKVDAIRDLAKSNNTKLLIMPSDVTGVLGGLETLTEMVKAKDKES